MQDPKQAAAPEAPQQGGGDEVVNAMMSVKDVMAKLQEIAPKGFPPEAQKLLGQAASSFDGFLQIILGGGAPQQQQQPAQAPQNAMAAGNPKAVPA